MKASEELQLVARAKENVHYYAEIYEYYLPKIFAYCLNRLNDKDLAQDIAADVFRSGVEGLKSFDERKGARYGSLLYSIAHNKIVDFYRRNKRIFEVDMQVIDSSSLSPNYNESSEHDNDIQREELRIQVNAIIQQLKPRYQQLISLKFFTELEAAEIAEIMNTKVSNVNLLVHRALKSFQKKWQKLYPESEIF